MDHHRGDRHNQSDGGYVLRGVEGKERECRMGGWGLKLGGEGEQGEAAGGG